MHVYDAFHAETALIPVARINGITNAIVSPASGDTLPGQDSFIQLAGKSAEEMLTVRDIAMPLNFTGAQRRNQNFEQAKFPFTRMGMAAQLRQTFIDAQDYEQKLAAYDKKKAADPDKAGAPPKRDLKLEALLPYLHEKKPVVLAAEQSNDLQTAMGLAKEFHLKVILNHLSHSSAVLDQVAASGFPVIVGPIYEQPKENERYDAVYKMPAEMAKRGIKIAFASYDSHNVRNLPYAAGYATAFGLPWDEALKALTLNPAQMFGLDKDLGSLDVGKMANVVVSNGDPLDVKTDVKHVFIAGEEIPLVNKQTQLRDQYWK
jgi:imidazolonepropionase-like amidohydrolase